ncbi:unnamed protein product [Acanthoscelides obtectus]|uniref:Uncharacterized protein n=1 Tax=Acanthoscelides obtectus TaxID=200917 RepID=A0A9P0L6J1_ACAOB|nr:unnamed protein product [Acanthoscelides obtectus]CAK1653606.1 hypothetical protein AOBTE_LOCUS18301 [Acanthoscelides obtectus]
MCVPSPESVWRSPFPLYPPIAPRYPMGV